MVSDHTLFQELANRYAAASIAFPNLKAVTLAQWALESGKGTSELAVKHYNFGGLKWRDAMIGYAAKVMVTAHDGTDAYCAFAGIDEFIKGYWRFLERPVYDGWKDQAHAPEAFIRFIGAYYCPKPGYADDVLRLLDEATHLLAAAGSGANTAAAAAETEPFAAQCHYVGAGHSQKDPGATASGYTEAELVTELRDHVARALRDAGAAVMTDGEGDANLPLPQSIALARQCALARIELHLNSDTGGASGTECLSLPGQKPLAQAVGQAIQGVLSLPLRGEHGWKPDSAGQHSSLGFCQKGHGVVVECFFLSNAKDLATYLPQKEEVAQAIAAAMLGS